jgi:pyridoxal phosphate-dependent aminotransferase EpsN
MNEKKRRIYLSPPHMSGWEQEFVRDAFESNWIAPLGPHVDAFEREFAEAVGVSYATALSSGTAALHLALRILTGRPGTGDWGRKTGPTQSNEVICSTFTFSASANAIAYEGGVPVFIDCDAESWNMDPRLLREELAACAKRGKLPRAVIVVDLYGQCADYDPILAACAEYGVPVIEDAAEALGATYWGQVKAKTEVKAKEKEPGPPSVSTSTSARFAGSFGAAAAFSFNGNKVITTGGGGMLVSHDKTIIDKARFLATQARDKAPYYQHSEIGFNYRMSNVLAAIGRGQLTVLQERIAARRRNFEFYQRALGDLPGIEFMPEASYGRCTRWLTCLTLGETKVKAKAKAPTSASTSAGPRSSVLRLLQALEKENIEARPLWKPMHLQPVFKGCRVRGGGVSERLFENGLCLPSGSALTEEDLTRICAVVRKRIVDSKL